jgi:hypothetical protein
MMEAVRTSETSVDNHFTRQYIPENNSEHHISSLFVLAGVSAAQAVGSRVKRLRRLAKTLYYTGNNDAGLLRLKCVL